MFSLPLLAKRQGHKIQKLGILHRVLAYMLRLGWEICNARVNTRSIDFSIYYNSILSRSIEIVKSVSGEQQFELNSTKRQNRRI